MAFLKDIKKTVHKVEKKATKPLHPNTSKPAPAKAHSDPIKDVTVFQSSSGPHPVLSTPHQTMGTNSVYNTTQVNKVETINGVKRPEKAVSAAKVIPRAGTTFDANLAPKPTMHTVASPHQMGEAKVRNDYLASLPASTPGQQKNGKTKTAQSTNAKAGATSDSDSSIKQWWEHLPHDQQAVIMGLAAVGGAMLVGFLIIKASG